MISMPDWNSNSKITWSLNNLPTNYIVTKNSVLYVDTQRYATGEGYAKITINNFVYRLGTNGSSKGQLSFLVSAGDIITIAKNDVNTINAVLIPCK